MSYNEYMIEYQIIAGDTIQNNFAFLEASSPENARDKLILKRDEMIKIINVVLCDEDYWRLK